MFRRVRSSAALPAVIVGWTLACAAMLPDGVMAQSALPVCPVIVSPLDPGLCQVAAQASPLPAKYELLFDPPRSSLSLFAYNPDDGTYLMSRRPLFAARDISLLSRRNVASAAAPSGYDMVDDGDKIGVYSDTDDGSGTLETAAYDVPLFDGLALSNTSAIHQDGSADNESRSASSKFGFAYQDYGLTFRVDPDAAANWSDLAGSGSRRFGIDNSVSAMLARDLTLTLSSGYTTESAFGDPTSASSNERHRIAIAQHFASGYKLGASLQRRNEYRYLEERDLNILGLQIGVPLGETLNLTASHEFGFGEKRNLSDADAVPFYGRQQTLDLQLHWTPAALASRAMTLMAGYTLSQDDMTGTDDAYLTQARLNLAMRF